MPEVAIAGGGLAGLVAARHLADAGVDVQLFERREAVGGRVRTLERDGFVLDRGFQALLTAYPAARRELDYDALDLRSFPSGAVLAGRDGRSVFVDPFRDPRALPAALFSRAASVRDKLRLLALRRRLVNTPADELLDGSGRPGGSGTSGEPGGPEVAGRPGGAEASGEPGGSEASHGPRGADVSIRDGLREAGFSGRFVERVAAPLFGAVTLDRSLSTSMAVFEYAFKMLAEGPVAVPATGMGAVPAQLADAAGAAGATVATGTAVTAVRPADGEVTVDLGGESIAAAAAIVATDPPTARELTGVAAIPVEGRGCVTQFYGLPVERALDPERPLVLDADGDGEAPNHVVAHSAVAPGHAPVGRSLLSATFLGTPDSPPAALAERTRRALARWFPERRFDGLDVVHTERVPFAQFAQPPGFRAGLPRADAPDGRVVLAGDYTRWSSIQGALASGRDAALATLAELDGR